MKLSFRQKGISKEIKKKIEILAGTFLAAVIFFSIVLNYQGEGKVTAMEEPTLPTVTMEALGMTMNELHGYVTKMDACYMRDAVVPLDSDRKLPIKVKTYGYDVDSISYEIRSMDTERKIAETQVTDYVETKDTITKTLQIENLVEQGEEYLFILTIKSGSQSIYYYTRIMQPSACNEQECLDFAMDFHNTALSEDASSLSSYLETSADEDMNTLSNVTIRSSLSQVGWAGFQGSQVAEPVVELKDINSTYTSIVLYYQMQQTQDSGAVTYYNVEEYFKVRYTADRMYLLDYSRSMEEIMNGRHISINSNVLDLGIIGADFEYLSNETGTIVSFVQAGELYEYNQNTRQLTRVFSFMGEAVNDTRAYYPEHNIVILNIDESGTMDFVVYGYMNAGEHEGECGINLYHYDSETGHATEQAFITSTKSYQILNANFSSLLYENSEDDFYIMVGGTLLKVDLDTLATQELLTGMADDQYAVSKSGRYIAWIDQEKMSDEIQIMDLETNTTRTITAEAGEKLKPLAFMDEDFVYGIARETDIAKDAAGTTIYPMYRVFITDIGGEEYTVLKEYQKSGYYVTEVRHEDYTLYLTQVTKEGDSYVAAAGDTIKNSAGAKNKAVLVAKTIDSSKGQITTVTMAEPGEEALAKLSYKLSGMITADTAKNISINVSDEEDKYFVYVGSRVILATQDVQQAINQADTEMGIVVNNKQQYIWKRGRKAYQNPFTGLSVSGQDSGASSSAQCISAILVREGENMEVHTLLEQGGTPLSILQNTLKDATVLDLTGCNLTQVLYYVSQGNPVYALTDNNQAVLIIGYDSANATLYNPVTKSIYKVGLVDGTNMFSNAGNVFISYMK